MEKDDCCRVKRQFGLQFTMKGICRLIELKPGKIAFDEDLPLHRTGTLIPKNGREYHVVIINDNPDIDSLRMEKKLCEQALKEIEKQIGYNIKIWHQFEWKGTTNEIDVTVEFKNYDQYFTDNTIAYAGFPNGGFRGKMVFNNKFALLDGYNRTGAELRKLGILLPNMQDIRTYLTYNFRQIFKHEFLHILGIEHEPDDPDSVIYPIYAFARTMMSELTKAILHDEYGNAGFLKRMLPDSYIRRVMVRPESF